MRADLANGTVTDIKLFAMNIIELAAAHHENNVPLHKWSGQDLCREFASSWRGLHRLMASGLYNKTRETLDAKGAP